MNAAIEAARAGDVGKGAAVVQTNSATSEESAAASEELSSQASLLQQMISQFKLSEDH